MAWMRLWSWGAAVDIYLKSVNMRSSGVGEKRRGEKKIGEERTGRERKKEEEGEERRGDIWSQTMLLPKARPLIHRFFL